MNRRNFFAAAIGAVLSPLAAKALPLKESETVIYGWANNATLTTNYTFTQPNWIGDDGSVHAPNWEVLKGPRTVDVLRPNL